MNEKNTKLGQRIKKTVIINIYMIPLSSNDSCSVELWLKSVGNDAELKWSISVCFRSFLRLLNWTNI